MHRKIRKAAVLGSGVMGAAIGAHLANAGVQVLLLDRLPEPLDNASSRSDRNKLAQTAIAKLANQKPSPIYSKESLTRMEAGNFADDLPRIREADWVIEAVIENLDAKRTLLTEAEKHWQTGTIVTSNTSGISINQMAEGLSAAFRRHFFGTHFFNPPRYMKLVEMIPCQETDAAIMHELAAWCERKLGKGVVFAKDTPNFIANRIGTYGLLITLQEMKASGLTVSEVDAMTGPLIGRPKSATFRTLDLVGLDTFVRVADNVMHLAADEEERKAFQTPDWLRGMVERGQIGEKAGQGFYRVDAAGGKKTILQWDDDSSSYVPNRGRSFASVEQAKGTKRLTERIRQFLSGTDDAGIFLWNVMKRTLLYSAAVAPSISDDMASVDRAMKWGFNWELGPFELWDALGVADTVKRMEQEGEQVPDWVTDMLKSGQSSFYDTKEEKRVYVSLGDNKLIRKNAGASLIDIGDGVACLAFHSTNDTIGPDVLAMVRAALDEVQRNYVGLVVGHQGKNFCVGANLMMLLMEAQDENWIDIERMITEFQAVSTAMKYFDKPIVSAPFAMTLGGGVEMCLPASHVQASAETYMGLVEAGVGLIPAGGGTKEMLVRHTQSVDFDGVVDLQPFVNRVFETIGMAKVSTSGEEAKQLGYLRASDRITPHPDYLLHDAKLAMQALAMTGYEPRKPKPVRVVGEPGCAVMKLGIYQLLCGGRISEHDAKIGAKLANVLAGGLVPSNSLVSEAYLLELEKEAFLSLCGEPKSQARMQHMLLTRKPLRN